MDAQEGVRDIDARLAAAGDERRAEHNKGYLPSAERSWDVPVPVMRKTARDLARDLRDAPGADLLEIAFALCETGTHECRSVAYEIVTMHRAAFVLLNATRLERLGRGLDNWGSVDHFGRGLSGPAWKQGQISDARVDRWLRSHDLWWRRVALVSTIALNERDRPEGDAERTLHVCRRLIDDREDMVVKAMSWALRELATRDSESVRRFLAEHEGSLAARVKREVRRKLETGKKN